MKKAPKTRTIQFRCISDSQLNLTDRIILSYLHKWEKMNYVAANPIPGKRPCTYRPLSNKRLNKATGFDTRTIKQTIQRLQDGGYIDEHRHPAPDHPNYLTCTDQSKQKYRYHRIVLTGSTNIKQQVQQQIVKKLLNGRNYTQTYFAKVLGVSRITAYRLLNPGKAINRKRDRGLLKDTKGVVERYKGGLLDDTKGVVGCYTSIHSKDTTENNTQIRTPAFSGLTNENCQEKTATEPFVIGNDAATATVDVIGMTDDYSITDLIADIIHSSSPKMVEDALQDSQERPEESTEDAALTLIRSVRCSYDQ